MKGSTTLVGLLLALTAGMAQAEYPAQEISMPQDAAIFQGSNSKPSYMMTANDAGASSNAARNVASAAPATPAAEFGSRCSP